MHLDPRPLKPGDLSFQENARLMAHIAELTQGRDLGPKAIADLDGIGVMIEKQRWTQISQTLGASRDLREAMSFLTRSNTVKEGEAGFAKDATENKEAAALAKKVFKDLDTVQLASSKKLPDVAMKGYTAYTEDMPKLLNALD